jgi:hypothetical protein
MAAQDVLVGCGRAFDERKALVQDRDSLLRFGVVPGWVQLREGAVTYELDVSLTAARISESGRSVCRRPIR